MARFNMLLTDTQRFALQCLINRRKHSLKADSILIQIKNDYGFIYRELGGIKKW